MAVNLGPAAFEAIVNLKASPDWRQFVHALAEQWSSFAHKAVDGPPGYERVDATGYARALRDLVAHIEQIETGARTPKPPVRSQPHG